MILDGKYSILYEEVDESEVELLKFAMTGSTYVEEFRYPRAGATNAKSNLKLITFSLNESNEVGNIQHKELEAPLENQFSWLEYVVRLGWTPDGKL